MDRPVTTLFMLMSLDGKISTGALDALDVDKTVEAIRKAHPYEEPVINILKLY